LAFSDGILDLLDLQTVGQFVLFCVFQEPK
jgi:hypothetical protein